MSFSHSKINTFKMCPKQYEYRYIQKLYPLEDSNSLIFGKLFHKAIDLKSPQKFLDYVDTLNLPSDDRTENNITLVLAMLDAYIAKFGYEQNIQYEVELNTNIEGEEFIGFIDAIEETEDGYWLHEYKTASIIDKDYIDKLSFNDQTNRYLYIVKFCQNALKNFVLKPNKPILGIKYRILKKPLIRQKKGESIMEFRNRLVEKMMEEESIVEVILTRTDEELQETYLDMCSEINMIKNVTRFTKTLSACSTYGRCQYMELCSNIEGALNLYKQSTKEGGEDNE